MNRNIYWLSSLFLILFAICVMCPGFSYGKELQPNSETQDLFLEAKALYLELLQFKDNKNFHKVGFDSCCPFSKWLARAESLRDHPNRMDLFLKGFSAGDIEKLGKAYLESHGKDTEYTKNKSRKFRQIFNLLKDDEYKPNSKEALSGVENFEKLVFTVSPQLKDLISFFDISYRDGHLIVWIKQLFLITQYEIQRKVYSAISELWKRTNLVKDKRYSTNVEVRYLNEDTGETEIIDLN